MPDVAGSNPAERTRHSSAAVAQLARARSWYEPGPRFDPGRWLHGDLDQLAGVTAFRPQDVRVRVPRALPRRVNRSGIRPRCQQVRGSRRGIRFLRSPLLDAQSDWRRNRRGNPARLNGLANRLAGSTPAASAGQDPAGGRALPDEQVSRGSIPRWPTTTALCAGTCVPEFARGHMLRCRKRINSPGPHPGDCRFEPGTEHRARPSPDLQPGPPRAGRSRDTLAPRLTVGFRPFTAKETGRHRLGLLMRGRRVWKGTGLISRRCAGSSPASATDRGRVRSRHSLVAQRQSIRLLTG
jgi:hypothetical protein